MKSCVKQGAQHIQQITGEFYCCLCRVPSAWSTLCYDLISLANFCTFFESLFQCFFSREASSDYLTSGGVPLQCGHIETCISLSGNVHCIKCDSYVFIQQLVTSTFQLTFFSDATSGRLRSVITSQQVAPTFPYPRVCPLGLHVNVSYF